MLLLLGLILFLPLDSNPPTANAQTPATPQKYEHAKWKTEPRELFFKYAAYVPSIDYTQNSDHGDPEVNRARVQNRVSNKVRKKDKEPVKRPIWTADNVLFHQKITPDDKPHVSSGTDTLRVVMSKYRLIRRHFNPKNIAAQISGNAATKRRTPLNPVPRLQWQHDGIGRISKRRASNGQTSVGPSAH